MVTYSHLLEKMTVTRAARTDPLLISEKTSCASLLLDHHRSDYNSLACLPVETVGYGERDSYRGSHMVPALAGSSPGTKQILNHLLRPFSRYSEHPDPTQLKLRLLPGLPELPARLEEWPSIDCFPGVWKLEYLPR